MNETPYNTPYDKPDSEGWWWLKHKNRTTPHFVKMLISVWCVEAYLEIENSDLLEPMWVSVDSYQGTWYKAYLPE